VRAEPRRSESFENYSLPVHERAPTALALCLGAALLLLSGVPGQAAGAPALSTSPEQVIVVSAGSYGSSSATLTAYAVSGGKPRTALGPWRARVGYAGFAPAGQKREGDGRTPSGTFAFQFMFGVMPNPGVHFPYRRVNRYDFWDDDPASALYNRWVDVRRQDPGASPEPMDVTPAYRYGAVIAYNLRRTPGAGSAIFIHVGTGGPTAGCVSLPAPELLRLLRWMRPVRSPAIEMGVGAELSTAAPIQPVAPSGGVPPAGG